MMNDEHATHACKSVDEIVIILCYVMSNDGTVYLRSDTARGS
jgi:hypothetical protein